MYVKMVTHYGQTAYYRKLGEYCFDFVTRKEYATDLSEKNTEHVLAHADWYGKQYHATSVEVEG